MSDKIDHIGIAVADLAAARLKYGTLLGKTPDSEETVAEQKVRVAMFRMGDTAIELLQGIDNSSPIAKYIEKHGEGIHHICFAVGNLDEALARAQAGGMERIVLPDDRGAGGHKIAFLHPKSTGGVLIELVEK